MTASLVLRGGRVLDDGVWVERDVTVRHGRITQGGDALDDASVLDATGCLVAPGLVDLQCNGAVGIDLRNEPERLWDVAAGLTQWGVTAWLPTIVTSTPDVIVRAQQTLRAGPPDGW